MKDILLVGGPGDGKVYTVPKLIETFYFAVVDQTDVTYSAETLLPSARVMMRKAAYRVRRIASSGHAVHNREQQVLLDWIGDS